MCGAAGVYMGKIFKIAVVEDEADCVEALQEILARYERERGCSIETVLFRSIETFLTDYKQCYDIVFMDIRLPGMNGMDGARRLREVDPVVTLIFITSLAQFAVQGYEVSALDYILKPVSYKNFSVKLDRALALLDARVEKTIVVSDKSGIKRMSVKDILFIEVRGHRLTFHLLSERTVEVCGSLEDLTAELKESGFSRCNSCYLLNMKYVSRVNAYTVTMHDGTELQISRRKKKAFMDELTAYMGMNITGGGYNS